MRRVSLASPPAVRLWSLVLFEKMLHAGHIDKDQAVAGVFEAWGKGLGDLEQRFLRGALALGVAAAGDELGQDRSSLGERQARTDAFLSRSPRRCHDMRVVAVPLDDRNRFLEQIRLASQSRREREQRDEKTSDTGHDEGREARDKGRATRDGKEPRDEGRELRAGDSG